MRRFIEERVEAGEKPATVRNKLVTTFKMQVPNEKKLLLQVQYIARRYMYKDKMLHDNDYIDEMVQLASKHRFQESIDDTTAFVFGFAVDDTGLPVLDEATEDSPLVVGFATKTTLRRLDEAKSFVLHLDATFKLNSKGYQ